MGIADGLRKLRNLGALEVAFEIDGTNIILATISPDEENDAQVYADEVYRTLPDDSEDEAKTQIVAWLDRYKLGVLCRSIVQIDDIDLRGVSSIEVGKNLDNGTPIKQQKHIFLREIVGAWSRSVRDVCFTKYGELLYASEQKARKGVNFEMVDIDSEINRLEDELRKLKEMRGDAEVPSVAAQVASGSVEEAAGLRETSYEAPPAPTPEPELSDEEKALLEEEQRVLEMRARRAERENPQPPPEPTPEPEAAPEPEPQPPVERVPLNRVAPQISQTEEPNPQVAAQPPARPPGRTPKIDPSIPVYREETEVLDGDLEHPQPRSREQLQLDRPAQGAVNPRFNPPGRRGR
jgi:hypothetical protein